MHIYEKEFDFVIQRAKSLDRPARMVVAGADCENIVKALPFEGATTFVDAFTFALLIIILVFKPTGLFGEKATDKV